MKSTVIALALMLLSGITKAQVGNIYDNRVYTTVDQQPVPPVGQKKYFMYLSKNIHTKSIIKGQGIRTKLVLEAIIEKDGTVSHIRVLKDTSPSTFESAVKLLNRSKWTPGMLYGKVVRTRCIIPITLDFQTDDQ